MHLHLIEMLRGGGSIDETFKVEVESRVPMRESAIGEVGIGVVFNLIKKRKEVWSTV